MLLYFSYFIDVLHALIILHDWPKTGRTSGTERDLETSPSIQGAMCWLAGHHPGLNEASLVTRVGLGCGTVVGTGGKEQAVAPLLPGKFMGLLAFSTENRLEGRNENPAIKG